MQAHDANMTTARKEPQNWPPKSPHEALLSSPSGRRKYQRQRDHSSVSPSPTKRRPMLQGQPNIDNDDDDEEDEEMLQLKLQAIEARLKIKRLQKARKTEEDGETDTRRTSSRPGTAASLRKVELPGPQSELQVPVSPIRTRRAPEEQRSPARVLLGIDKGLRAQDVSLKRASSFSTKLQSGMASGGLSRANSIKAGEAPRSKSFGERIVESRNREKEKEEKQARVEKSRSRGFGLQNIEGLKDGPASRADSALSTGKRYSHNTVSFTKQLDRAQSRLINDLRHPATSRPGSNLSSRTDASSTPSTASRPSSRGFGAATTSSKYVEISQRDESTDAPSFESFSGLHLRSRDMVHNVITRTLEGKTILTIPQLLKIVKAPDYDPPDVENDYVIMGVVASKSSPLTPKNAVRERSAGNQEMNAMQTNKFMVVKLTDLKWEVDLFLFDTGFSQFWKLAVGTLIAILNPDIMPPRTRDTGKFSLKLTSSDDTVLEIGTARDLDFCHAMRKDGKECGQWIDGRKTEFCDFHIELQVERSKRGRMEVNTMTGFGKGPSGTGKGGMFGGAGRSKGPKGEDLRREGKFHDKFLHETMFIAPGAGGAARLLDRDEQPWDGQNRAERHRKQLAEKEKERELAKKLGDLGNGAGGDYLRSKGTGSQPLSAEDIYNSRKEKPAAEDFSSLLERKAEDISLGPAKRKRIISGKSATTNEPVGWGGAFKRGLLLSPSKEFDVGSRKMRETSPAKKKARLLLPEKGIREPGRESLGTLDVGLIAAMDDEDDDLEVV
jgi:minichromosome maintenance protein 10